MERKIRCVSIGCGKMGKYIMKYAHNKGCEISGAFDVAPEIIGKDCGVIMDAPETGCFVYHVDELDAKLKEIKPDVALVATRSFIREIKDVVMICCKNGVNVVTTCDEGLYAWNSTPSVCKEIDEAAKRGNCTVTASGFQDVSYCHLVVTEAAAAHKIEKIKGSAMYNVEDYGIALAEHHGVGLSDEEFEEKIASADKISDEERQKLIDNGNFHALPMWNAAGWIASNLGLTVLSQKQLCTPVKTDIELDSKTMGRIMSVGEIIGMSGKSIIETEEGITIEAESIGKIYAPGEEDTNEWAILGEPDIYIENKRIDNRTMICSQIVSRIVDAINGPAGYITTDKFNAPRYYVKPMNEYIR